MNESLSEFETNLRAARPAGCDNLIAETFYRAGWNAHAVQLASPDGELCRSNSSRIAAFRTFGAGLVCGLVLTVTVWSVRSVTPANEKIRFCAATAAGNYGAVASLVVVADDEANSAGASGNPWSGFLPPIALWKAVDSSNVRTERLPAARPLSPAARHHWSSLVAMEPGSWAVEDGLGHENSPDDGLQLRSSPFRAAMIDELL